MKQKDALYLLENDRIAVSKTRHCYLHPEDNNKVIKIVVRPPKYFWRENANIKEWRYYQRLKKLSLPLDFIPKYYGFVETNLGTGLVSECIRDFDGSISVRLQKVLDKEVDYDIAEVQDKLIHFSNNIIERNIQLFDLNNFNILIRRTAKNSYQPISIDIKGPFNNYELIPISTYIPYFSRQKLKRRGKRLLDKIEAAKIKT